MRTRRMPRGQEGTLCLGLISEPDFITAHTGHPVNVAQHWETDETCGVTDPRRLGYPHFLEAGRPLSALGDSEAVGTRGRARQQAAFPTSAGEEATRLWVQKVWPAVVLSHLPVCWFPCRGTKGVAPGMRRVPDGA